MTKKITSYGPPVGTLIGPPDFQIGPPDLVMGPPTTADVQIGPPTHSGPPDRP